MALGVLNNLSAIYAENNLNNTSSNLQTVLQQLSSGSRINSGADDAAGLSLVNGLQANTKALSQSATNATEGVGLLQVADGALAQVTSLLNRAITLATEASNGTLDAAQAAAANQEYQSILSEINNIGSTTTYNQNQVFTGSTVSVYTGDSSNAGASVDSLYFANLNSSSLGDAGGTISYGSGQSAFIDLTASGAGALAQSGDTITAGSTITVKVLNANGTVTPKQISTGGVTPYSNTVGGMIQAINNSGLGLTATLTTGTLAGDAVAGADTGIQISGTFVGAGANPSIAAGYHVGITNSTMQDTQAGDAQTALQLAANGGASTGIATISYTSLGAAGTQSMANTNISSPASAQAVLAGLNTAISYIASQDGYIGAQINTLNSISQVMSTQQENIVSAQNAIQATDYAAATSNMSKYEILSQTGIAALAQANSVEQEVTKLLQ
jgi:flagellin